MAEISWPSPDNGRAVDESEYEQLAAHFTEDGFYMDPNGIALDNSGVAPVYADSSGRNVKVRANRYASVRGFGYNSGASDTTLTVTANASGSTRIDRVVLELSRTTWNVRSKVIAGTAGSGVPPALTRDEGSTGVFQVPVAQVTVANGAAVIAASNVSVDGHRVGSRIRAWLKAADMLFPKLGEIGFDNTTKGWFGWNGANRLSIANDSGWVDLSSAAPTAWEKISTTACRKKNDWVFATIQLKRIGTQLSRDDADGSHLITLPPGFRPVYGYVYGSASFTSGINGRLYAKDNGEVWVDHLSSSVPVNNNLRTSISFPV